MTEINIDQLTPEQIETLQNQLAAKSKRESQQKEKAKKVYETKREKAIKSIVTQAINLNEKMAQFKSYISDLMEDQHQSLTEYGEIRSNSKGGFSITSADGNLRVTRTRDTEPFWDERGTKAVAMLKEFLEDTAKKRDKDLFEILMGFLSRNDKGDLEYGKVFTLLKYRQTFNDPRWHEGLDLLLESFRVNLRGYGYEVKMRDEQGKWNPVTLNFTAI